MNIAGTARATAPAPTQVVRRSLMAGGNPARVIPATQLVGGGATLPRVRAPVGPAAVWHRARRRRLGRRPPPHPPPPRRPAEPTPQNTRRQPPGNSAGPPPP